MQLETERLILREWQAADRGPFAEMNADAEVMRYFPNALTPAESYAFVDRIIANFAAEGFGLWAAELQATGEFIGYVGLARPRFEAHFTPCVEIGWRLKSSCWGHGYAPEAAREVLRDGFERVGLVHIHSWTATTNLPSIRVMEKIGMQHIGHFDHPSLADDSPLKPHILYRITAPGRES